MVLMLGIFYVTMKQDDNFLRNIVVYSGSFNPLHIGHKAIIQELSRRYDWVYLIVTPKNPLKIDIDENTVDDRIDVAHKAMLKNEIFNVTVSDIEKNMLPPYYTIRTLDELQKQNPKNSFSLVIGADNLRQLREWKDYQRILLEYGVIVFPRGKDDVNVLENLRYEYLKENTGYKIEIINTLIPNISSTEIRTAIKDGINVDNLLM
jgi:nicotinate-nucleotide adenylyltransferase